MRILVLGINYWPEETGIGPFNTLRCEYLASQGHQVTICTGRPYYPEWQVPPHYRGKLWQRETRNGVTILRSYQWVPRQVTSLKRIVHEASYLASSFVRALGSGKPDVIFVASPPLGLGLNAFLLSRNWGVPYVFHIEDLQPDAAANLGMLPNSALRLLYRLERFNYNHAALVTTLTDGMRDRVISKGIPAEKVLVFSHATDPEVLNGAATAKGNVFREAFGLKGKFIVLHAGNMGVKQGMDVILDAAEQSRHLDDIVYLLVGDGSVRQTLESRARSAGLANVRFLPLQPKTMFLHMLAAADLCLVTQQRSVADIVFPSKTVTLLAAGRPVVASINSDSEIARVVQSSGAGVVVAPEDPAKLLDAILRLRQQPALRAEMSVRGRQYAIHRWSGDNILRYMESQLEVLTGSPAAVRVPMAKSATMRSD